MKKLIFYLLLLSSTALIWKCNDTAKPPKNVISLADFALEAMIQNAHTKMCDSMWLHELYTMRDLDHKLHAQLDLAGASTVYLSQVSGTSPKGKTTTSMTFSPSCCYCGSGCCGSCDTTHSSKSFVATSQVTAVSAVVGEEKSIGFKATSLGNTVNMFEPTAEIPKGDHFLEIETSVLRAKLRIPFKMEGERIIVRKHEVR